MKVEDLVDDLDFNTGEGWGNGYTHWLYEMGFKVLERRAGPLDNTSDGKTHDYFTLAKDGSLYELEIEGNRYDWDDTQIEKLLGTEIKELTGVEKKERLEQFRVKVQRLKDGIDEATCTQR